MTSSSQGSVRQDLPGGGRLAWRSIQELILWSRAFRRRFAVAYAASCALIVIAIGVRLLLEDALSGVPYVTIFPAVIIATFLGGLGPGLLAAMLGGAGAWYFLLPRTYSFAFEAGAQPVSLLIYLGVAVFQCLLINWLIRVAEQNAALASRNDLLLRELQHRVKNHLQIVSALLSLQAARAEPSARAALLEARRRLDVISSLYANASDPTEKVDVAEHLQRICAAAQQSFGHVDCDVSVTVPPNSPTWSMHRVMPLSLIANELLTNAFRHGLAQGPGHIEVALRLVDGVLELSVSDDGGRLPADFDLGTQAGFGLSIVQRLASELDGQVRVLSDGQSRFIVTAPA